MEVISKRKPHSRKRHVLLVFGMLSFFFLMGVLAGGWEGVKIILPMGIGVTLLFIVIESYDKIYDGWILSSDGITLCRVDLIREREEQKILYKDIKSILYVSSAGRRPLQFQFCTNKKKLRLQPHLKIFELAATLKYLQEQGIKIDFYESDAEIRLYLEGSIEAVPMTNDMKINNGHKKTIV